MSIRAHIVKKIEYEEGSLFNLWHDETFMELLENASNVRSQLNDDGCGMIELRKKDIENVRKEFEAMKTDLTPEQIKETETILVEMEKYLKNRFVIQLDCF